MKYLKEYRLFESVNKNQMSEFLLDFGFFISLNLTKSESYCVDDDNAKIHIKDMLKRLREPIINNKTYFELIKDINSLYTNPKLLSVLMNQIRLLLNYIEPRIKKFIKEGEIKNNWINKIENFKEKYKNIIS